MQQEEESSECDKSSSDSSPEKSLPFCALYVVEVEGAVKDGDSVQFTILAKRVTDANGTIINRVFEDVEWLHHCITTQNNIDGVIIPPLPQRPDIDLKSAENKSKQQLGNDTKILQPDDYSNDCKNLHRYLTMMLNHPAFGSHDALDKFLCQTEAPVRTKVKKGLLTIFSDVVEGVRKGSHKDIDEYFQKKREWTADYSKVLKETSLNFNNITSAQLRLSKVTQQLAALLTISDGSKDRRSTDVYKILLTLSWGLDQVKDGLNKASTNDENTLGNTFDLYNRYMESVKAMLFRRTCLLLSYEEANHSFVKAKPIKRQAAEEHKYEAEKSFEKCSDTACSEMKKFLQHRILMFGESLTKFTELQIKMSRNTYTLLNKTLLSVQEIEI